DKVSLIKWNFKGFEHKNAPKELLSQGKMPVGWKKGATNIGSSTEQPKWANKFKTKMEKMGQEYSDEKIANLANWHKDSHAITKEADGSPKVFYHGSTAKFSAFKPNPKSGGIWLTTDIERAHPHYTQSEEGRHHLYKVFVNAKKIYRHTDDIQTAEPYSAGAEKFYNDLIKAGYDAIDLMDKDILIVLKPNQIKSIDNKGTFNPRSKMMNAYTKVELPIALVGGGLGYIGTQSIADGYKNKDTTNQNRAKQYAKFLSEAKEPTQDAPDELYKAYSKAKKDLNKPKSK
ncbi:ADP-ribosyltransferase-containing protein, partial [Campylobacter hyointestinalis]